MYHRLKRKEIQLARKQAPGKTRKGTIYQHSKPWKAAVKVQYKERFLGYFETKEEAEAQERAFRLTVFGTEEVVRKPVRGFNLK